MAKKWYQTATVKGAIILALGGLAVAGLNIWQARSQLTQDNQNYKTEIAEKNKTIKSLQQKLSDKVAKIQQLEIELTPFKTIALAKYPGSESEAMQKLAADVWQRDCLSFRVIKILIQLHSASSLPFYPPASFLT